MKSPDINDESTVTEMSKPDLRVNFSLDEDSVIRAIFEGTAAETGNKFFSALVKNLCRVLNVKGAWVTEYIEESRKLVSLAFWMENDWVKEFEYFIAGSPCEQVITSKSFVQVKENVVSVFPRDPDLIKLGAESYMGAPLMSLSGRIMGHLAVIDNVPLKEETKKSTLLKIFAERAAAELQRIKAETEIKEKETKLRYIINSAMDSIIEIDQSFAIRLMNPSAEKLFQAELNKLAGRSFLDFLYEETVDRFKDLIFQLSLNPDGEKYIWITEGLRLCITRELSVPVEASVSQYIMNNKIFYTIILRNINDRVKAQEKISFLQSETEYLKEELKTLQNQGEIIGRSRPVRQLLKEINLVARTDSTVLISGETGTGKELIANEIYIKSRRNDQPFIKVNCAAIPVSLIESELFGHVQGAFTGATKRRIGRFELADKGTIFLDEIGELQLDLQSKLLRILQEGEFEPVGSSDTKKVDVRVIAATNRNLADDIKDGKFREDLFYRLNVFPIISPPLRERGDDIIELAEFFISKISLKTGIEIKPLDQDAVNVLHSYSWPGNIRELQNVIERAVIISDKGKLRLDFIMPSLAPGNREVTDSISDIKSHKKILNQADLLKIERENIRQALDQTGWKISGENGAARILGLPATTLSSRIKALGIKRPAH